MKLDIFRIGLDPLLHFEAIARLKSLKLAARELRLSQPAVTQSLRKLEESLGVCLCVRSRGGFSLTEAGQRLFVVTRDIKDRLRQYEGFLCEGSEFDGLLCIGVIDNFQNKAYEAAVAKTIQRFPKMKLSIQVHAAKEIQDLVASGELDVGLGIFNQKLEPLTYRVVGSETIAHYISENHPLWACDDISKADLKKYRKTWIDIVSRDRSALEGEIFSGTTKQNQNVSSYANNLNAGTLILRSGTSIVPLPAEYLESRKLSFKFRSLDHLFRPYSLKQQVAVHKNFLNASPAAKYFYDQLLKLND